jgi:hypothetical protein
MSILFFQDSIELLKLSPCEFRRVYTIGDEQELKYSHSDVVVVLENGERAMVEIVQGMLNNGTYVVRTSPTDITFDVRLTKSGAACVNWLKKIIFMTFPDMPTKDIYCQEIIRPTGF